MSKNKLSVTVKKIALYLLNMVLGGLFSKLLSCFFNIYEWLQDYYIKKMLIVLAGIITGIAGLIIAYFIQKNNIGHKKFPKLYKSFPLIIVFFSSMLIFYNAFNIQKINPAVQLPDNKNFLITISSDDLWEKDRFDLPIDNEYRDLYMTIQIQGDKKRENSEIPYNVEIELVKLVKGDWESIIDTYIPEEKLIITGMYRGNAGENYYYLNEGEYRIQERGAEGINLNKEKNQLRINFRNTMGFNGNIIFSFGEKPKGE